MATFDVDSYFANRSGSSTGKLDALAQASQDKVNALTAFRDSKAAASYVAPKPANADSWVSKLGLNPDKLPGEVVNLAASLGSGATRVAGQLASLPANLLAISDEANIDDVDVAAYTKYKQGIATPEDVATLSRSKDGLLTTFQLIERAADNRKTGMGISEFMDTSKTVHSGKRDDLAAELGDNFQGAWNTTKQGASDFMDGNLLSGAADVVSGVARLGGNAAHALVTNKGAVGEYVIENIPQLALGVAGKAGQVALAASNAGYGAEYYQKGIKEYQDANEGALPSVEQRKDMGLHAALAVGAEQVGDMVQLGAMKLAKKTADDLTRTGFKQALKNIQGAGVKGLTTEAPTEAFQTYAEGEASLQPASDKDIYIGGVIGGAAGAVMTAGGRTLAELTESTPEHVAKRAGEVKTATEHAVAVKANDTSAYLDPKNRAYDPVKAAEVHFGNSQQEATTAEEKQTNLEKVSGIVTGLEEQRDTLKDQVSRATPAGIQTEIDSLKESLATATPEVADRINMLIEGLEDEKAAVIAKPTNPKEIKQLELQVAKLDRQIAGATEVKDNLATLIHAKGIDLAAEVAIADATVDPTDSVAASTAQKAVNKVLVLSMAAPDTLSHETATRLANNAQNGLSTSQRDYLRQFSAARLAENALKDVGWVAQDVLGGTPGAKHLGIVDYRNKIGKALSEGNQKKADRLLGLMDNFATGHAGKVKLFNDLFTEAKEKRQTLQMVRNKDGNWERATEVYKEDVLRANGGLDVHYNSGGLLKSIKAEAEGIAGARKTLQAAYALKFTQSTQATVVNPKSQTAPAVSSTTVSPVAESTKGQTQSTDVDSTVDLTASSTVSETTPAVAQKTSKQQITDPSAPGYVPPWEDFTAEEQEVAAEALTTFADVITTDTSIPDAVAKLELTEEEVTHATENTETTPVTENQAAEVPQGTEESNRGLRSDDGQVAGEEVTTGNEVGESDLNPPIDDNPSYYRDEDAEAIYNVDEAETGVVAQNPTPTLLELLREMQPRYADRSFRKLNTTMEQPILDKALDTLRRQFGKEIAALRGFVAHYVHGTKEVAAGTFYGNHDVIGLNPDVFHEVVDGLDDSPEERVLRILAHELAHARDKANGTIDTEGNVIYASEYAATLSPDGEVYNEVLAAMAADTPAGKLLTMSFDYIVGKASKLAPQQVPREMYAQLYALYLIHSELMKNALPVAYAKITQEAETYEENQEGVVENQSIPVGEGSTAADEQSTPQGYEAADVGTGNGSQLAPYEIDSTSPGILSVFTGFNKDLIGKKLGEYFASVNPIAQFMRQSLISERHKSNRPLVAVKDLLKSWNAKRNLHAAFVADTINDEQQFALDTLKDHLNKWVPLFKENFRDYLNKAGTSPANKDFINQDMMQHLHLSVDGKKVLDVEENVKTAMAYAMYHWIVNRASAPALLKNDQITRMHGKKDSTYVAGEGVAFLQKQATLEETTIDGLGGVVLQVLGVQATEEAPQDLLPRLKNALGTHVLAMLEKEGFIKRESKDAREVMGWLTPPGVYDESDTQFGLGTTFDYVSFVRQDDHKLTSDAQRIRDANVGTSAIIEKFFGVEDAPRMAGTKPVPFTQKTAKGTSQEIPAIERQAIEETMAIPHKAIPEVFAGMDFMGREAILRIAGAKYLEGNESRKIHANNLRSVEAQNQNLENQFDLMMEMHEDPSNEEGYDQEFFIEQSVGRNFRAFFSNQSLNQQTSKIHRYSFYRPDWQATLDLSNEDQVNAFKIAVMMNLGLVKTDQQPNAESMKLFVKALEKNPEVNQAAQVLIDGLEKDDESVRTPANVALIERVTIEEGMVAFQALIAYAKFLHAEQENKPTVTVTMLVGADGKTNGPIMTNLALGAAKMVKDFYKLLNRGGIFSTDAEQEEHYSEYYQKESSLDLYEDLAKTILESARSKIKDLAFIIAKRKESGAKDRFDYFTKEQFAAIEQVTKTLVSGESVTSAGRNMVKGPITELNYGSAITKSIQGMEDRFIAGIDTGIEELAEGKRKGASFPAFFMALNTLIKLGDYKLTEVINPNMSEELALAFKMSIGQEKAIRKAYQTIIGKSVKVSMNEYFEVLIKRRGALNLTIGAAFTAYDAAYQALRAAEVARLLETGDVASRETTVNGVKGVKEALHELTSTQEQVLQKQMADLAPIMHSDYSLQDVVTGKNGKKKVGNLKAGLYMAKTKAKKSGAKLYTNKVGLRNKITRKGESSPYLDSQSTVRQEVSPGAAGLANAIQSSDSANMHKMLIKVKGAHNVHDEGSHSVLKVTEVAHALNEGMVDTLLHYSPAREARDMLERIVIALAGKVARGEVAPQVVTSIYQQWADSLNKGKPEEEMISDIEAGARMMDTAVSNAFAADTMRLGAYAIMKSVDQYTWEGGQYTVTPDIRKQAQTELDNLSNKPSPRLREAIEYLTSTQEALRDATEAEYAQKVAGKKAAAAVEKLGGVTTTAWGQLGQSTERSETDLEVFFNEHPAATVAEVITYLQTNESLDEFSKTLLDKLQAILKDSPLTLKYVTPATKLSEVTAAPDKPSHGWYVPSSHEIYLLSPEFQHSKLTTELVIHEILHGVLARTIEHAETTRNNDKTYSAEEVALVAELKTLLRDAKTYVQTNKLWQFNAAISSVHELLSYGLTDKAFQDQVLKRIKIAPTAKTRKSKLLNAMDSFISTITRMIFRSSSDTDAGGMALLIRNAAGLMEQSRRAPADGYNQDRGVFSQVATPDSTTHTIYTALDDGKQSPTFSTHLQGLLSGIVNKLHGPYGSLKALAEQNQAMSAVDLWLKSKVDGIAPFASEALASGLSFTEQQAFVLEQVEVTMAAAMEDNKSTVFPAYRELIKLHAEARERITPAVLLQSGVASSQQQAEALHTFIFKMEGGADQRSGFLARFVAMGLTHEGFNKVLAIPTTMGDTTLQGKTFAKKLQTLFEMVMDFLNGKLTGTYRGQQANQKLQALVDKLVTLEAKKRIRLVEAANAYNPLDSVDAFGKDLLEKGRKGVLAVAGSKFIKENSSALVKATGTLARVYANDQVETFLNGLEEFRNKNFDKNQGVIAGALRELRGPKAMLELLLATKNNEKDRKAQITQHTKGILAAFAEEGKQLSQQSKKVLTVVVLRTGLHTLLKDFNMLQIEQLVGNTNGMLDQQITYFEKQLAVHGKLARDYRFQAEALAYFRVTGKWKTPIGMLNAHNIARMYGSGTTVAEAKAQQAEPIIDTLASLYALKHSTSANKAHLTKLMQAERARPEGNGVEFVLRLQQNLDRESLARNFAGNPVLMTKGYLPETYNPHTAIEIATEAAGAALLDQGYLKKGKLEQDPLDPASEAKFIYVLKDGGLPDYLSGAVSMTGESAKGSSISPFGAAQNHNMVASITRAKQQALRRAIDSVSHFVPGKTKHSYLSPIYNPQGGIVDWRYLMQEDTKDDLLERENRVEHVLATLAGSIVDKEVSKAQNRKVMEALYAHYLQNYSNRSHSFVKIGQDATEQEHQEQYRMLSKDTRMAIKEIWGDDNVFVPVELKDMIFGYRMPSIAEAFTTRKDQRTHTEAAMVFGMTWTLKIWAKAHLKMNDQDAEKYSKRAAVILRRGERGWQEMVKLTKDIIVVRTGVVLGGNVVSNMFQLKAAGLSVAEIIRYSNIGMKGATDYHDHSEELAQLVLQLKTGTVSNPAKLQLRITELENALARNPVRKLIDSGLMPTIAEDVQTDEDPYAYETKLGKWSKEQLEKINPSVLAGLKVATVSKDTDLYKSLNRLTQLSDFVARYALYEHLTSMKEPMTHEEATHEAAEAFVIYDVPMQRRMEYWDKMGLTMFMKYFWRIQRVIVKLTKEHPMHMLLTVLLNNYFSALPLITDSSLLSHIGNNPLHYGPLEMLGLGDDLVTSKALLSLIK